MAWAEAHMLIGASLYFSGNLGAAVPLAIMSHWPLDDLNVGYKAKIYHGIGEKTWVKVLTSIARVPIWACLLWIFWHYPMAMACALPAWLIVDWEWILHLFGRKDGIGLHREPGYMWPKWLHTQWGLIPWFIAFGLFLWLLT